MKRVSPSPAPVVGQSLCMCSVVSCPRDLLQGNTLLGGSWVVIAHVDPTYDSTYGYP